MIMDTAFVLVDGLLKRQALTAQTLVHNFDKITTATIALLAVTLFSMALRLYVRLKMLRQFGKEDWAMVATVTFFIAYCSILFATSQVGKKFVTGQFKLQKTFDRLTKAGYTAFACTLIALKFSLGFFFLRILGHKKPQRYTIYAIIALTTLTGLAYFGFAAFTCAQIKDVGGLTGNCKVQKPATAVFTAFSVVNILGDFTLTGMGLVALFKAKLSNTTKLIAGILLAFGSVGGVASIVRLAIVWQPVNLTGFINQLFNTGLWATIEQCTGIVAANLAMIRPLLQLFLEKSGLVSTVSATTRVTTAPSASRSRVRTANRDHGDVLLLDEIRKETTVTVDEEKGSVETWSTHRVRTREV